jgi:hypothetical protein
MKANKKFIEADEYAVSADIGVILMLAITVAIAATIYVYVGRMIDDSDHRINTNHDNRGNVHSFFCGKVVIEKFKGSFTEDDELRVSFYEPGNYSMRFTPDDFNDGCCNDCNNLHSFNITDDSFTCHCGEPYVCSFKAYNLRHDIRVNVYLDGQCESFVFD